MKLYFLLGTNSMNETVKRLMLEAGYAAPELASRAHKLVELVVLECARVGDEFGTDIENGNIFGEHEYDRLTQHTEANHFGPLVWESTNLFKKHFGVK